MDPLSITLGVISITTALKDIIEVGERIYDSFARASSASSIDPHSSLIAHGGGVALSMLQVSDNLHHAQSLARDVNCTIYQLKDVCEEHHEALKSDVGMRRALGNLLSEMHAFEMKIVPLIPVTGRDLKHRLRSRVAGWLHSKTIEARISELKNHVTKCHSEFTMFAVIRIEAKLESIQRTTTQGVQLMRRGVSTMESVAQNTISLRMDHSTVVQSPSTCPPPLILFRNPDEVTDERAMARIYLSCQIKSITKWFIKAALVSYLHSACNQPTQDSALADTLRKMDGYTPILQPLFGANWFSLHRHTVVLALQIRNSLEENDEKPHNPVLIQHVAVRLPFLSTLLHHLNMIEEAGAIVNWAITVYKAIQFASPSAISPRLIYCLHSLSILCDTAGDQDGAYIAMDEALSVSKHLQAITWNSEVPVAVRAQYSEIMTGYASILARQKGDYTGARDIATSAVKNLEDILDISPVCSSHQVVDGYVKPTPLFLRHLDEKGGGFQQPVFIYAQALRVRAYFYGSGNATAGSLGDTLRAVIIFQHLCATHRGAAHPQLADTLYDVISHPDKSYLSPKQLLEYADVGIAIYRHLVKNGSTGSKCLLGGLQIRAEILHNLCRDDEMLETWRDYVNVAQKVLREDAFADALLTVATSLRKLKMFSQSALIQTRSGPYVFEIMNRASMHAQAKWHFNLFLDFFSAGCFTEAARAAGRSVEKYHTLECTNPGAWSASLARGLSALALCLSLTGDHNNALLSCAEAEEIFQLHPDQARVKKMYRRACEIGALVSEGRSRSLPLG